MPLRVWEDTFRTIRAGVQDDTGTGHHLIVWHGGEPSLLPPDYVLDVIALQRSILGREIADGRVRNAVQTNLYRWTESLAIFGGAGFSFSVSTDLFPGGRALPNGGDPERDVLANLRALAVSDVPCGVLLVLGRHNHLRLVEAYEILVDVGVQWLAIAPVFAPGNAAPIGDLVLDPGEVTAALTRLAKHRGRGPHHILVSPLDRAAETYTRHLAGRQSDRAVQRIRVDPDGSRTWSPTHAQRERTCGPCRFKAACGGAALNDAPATAGGRCQVDYPLLEALDRFEPGVGSAAGTAMAADRISASNGI